MIEGSVRSRIRIHTSKLVDPDPGGPKTCGSSGSGSATLLPREYRIISKISSNSLFQYEGGVLEMFLTESQKHYYTAMKKLGRKKPQKVRQTFLYD
jgi:hypothetical protein